MACPEQACEAHDREGDGQGLQPVVHEGFTSRPDAAGGVPALKRYVSASRATGCFGRLLSARRCTREDNIDQERQLDVGGGPFFQNGGFQGYIHDVGGLTANFVVPSCPDQEKKGTCPASRVFIRDRAKTKGGPFPLYRPPEEDEGDPGIKSSSVRASGTIIYSRTAARISLTISQIT